MFTQLERYYLARNPEERVRWSIQKSQENLDSAIADVKAGRTFPAAEAIFRSIESSLAGLVYSTGTTDIEYPRYGQDSLTGRSALRRLVNEVLVRNGIITSEENQTYRRLVTELHQKSYIAGETFEESEIQGYSEFAEDLIVRMRATLSES